MADNKQASHSSKESYRRRNQSIEMASQTGMAGMWRGPSNVPEYKADRPWSVYIGGGVYLNDSNNLIDAFLEVSEASEELEQSASSNPLGFVTADVEPLIATLEELDGKVLTTSSSAVQAIPIQPIAGYELAIVNSISLRVAASFDYEPEEADRLRLAMISAGSPTDNLESEILATGVIVADTGLNIARDYHGLFGTSRVGITLKYQSIRLFERGVQLDDYEEEKLVDRHRDIKKHELINADIGLSHYWRKGVQTHVTINNINGRNYSGDRGGRYHHSPGVKVGTAYTKDKTMMMIEADATSTQSAFGLLRDEQRIRLAGAYQLNDQFGLGAGYQHVMEGRDDHAITLGANWQAFSWLKLQSGLIYSGTREIGGGLSAEVRLENLYNKIRNKD